MSFKRPVLLALSGVVYWLSGIATTAAGAAETDAINTAGERIEVHHSATTGLATFVTGRDGAPITVTAATAGQAPQPMDVLREYGHLFGVTDPEKELALHKVQTDALGHTHATYHQFHHGVRVFSGVLKIHQNAAGEFVAANGDFYPIPSKLAVTASLSAEEAVAAATTALDAPDATPDMIELVIVDPGWYGDPPQGTHLAYYFILEDLSIPLREAFFVDAHTGALLDHWAVLHTARVRHVHDGMGGPGLPGDLIRAEGDPPVGSPEDANRAYDYAGDVYDYFDRAFGRDSIDDAGMTLVLTVNSTAPPCPNAFWNGSQMVFCTGTVTDDVTAHEIMHGVTDFTADLIYQNQSGQLNESYSDIFGELIDLFNGDVAFPGPPSGPAWPVHSTGPGQDTPNDLRTTCSEPPSYPDGVRWLVGEDATAFGGAIRDMWDPPCEGDPDRANSPLQTCSPGDSGGVHSGSGIPNHAFAILVDGKTFNGQTVSAIGPIKAAAVWYRALTTYLTVASDFEDAYFALNQAAVDLEGTFPNDPRTGLPSTDMFTAGDTAEVNKALLAVEMNTEGACGATVPILDPLPPSECSLQDAFFEDDFESGVNGWTVSLAGTPDNPYDWVQTTALPYGHPGTAWYCLDLDDGCPSGGEESAVHILRSPVIAVPSQVSQPTLRFTHYLATEPAWDGGNVKISVDGGPWTLIPPGNFAYNPYNTTLNGGSNTNPLATEPAWSGVGGGWGTSLADLSGFVSGGENVQIAFEFGKDYCNGVDGWYVDDVAIYNCTCIENEDCDDGLFCNGLESCDAGFCVGASAPCGSDYCDEATDTCTPAALWDNFENGNVHGWDLYAPDSTATSGDWLIGDPNGTSNGSDPAQPENAFGGFGCAFTGQNTDLGTDDIDGGVVYLESPTIDLSGQSAAELRYVRWFYQRDLGDDPDDFFIAEVSDDNGASWVTLELLGENQSVNAWTPRNIPLEGLIALTSTVKIRFGASDGTEDGDIVEAAIDDVAVLLVSACGAPAVQPEGPRSIAVAPAGGGEVALHVAGNIGDPTVSCVTAYVQADGSLGADPVYQSPAAWQTVHVRGVQIIPSADYLVQAECQSGVDVILSPSVAATTWKWGDVNDSDIVDFYDISLVVQAFQGNYTNISFYTADLVPCTPNEDVNFLDISAAVRAFQGVQYANIGCPLPCP